jgi:hypothetical protein
MSKTDTILVAAGEAITQYRFVKVATDLSGNSTVELGDTDGEKCIGVATAAAASGEEVLVATAGYTLVDFAEGAALGADITTDTDGKAILADLATHNILGYAAPEPVDGTTASIASGTRGRVYLYANKNVLVP